MPKHRCSHSGAAYLRLVVDNSGCLAFDKKRGIKLDPASFALTPHFLVDAGPIREAPKRFPVAHSTGRNVQETRHCRGAAQRVDNFVHCHSKPILSSCLKKVKRLERELIHAESGGTMKVMLGLNPNPRSIDQIAVRLLRTRLAVGLNQTDYCERAGLAKNTYNQYEKGKSRPELDKAFKLCDTFDLTLDWIYFGSPAGLPHELALRIGKITADLARAAS